MKSIDTHFQLRIPVLAQVALLFVMMLPFMNRPFWDDELFSVRTASSLAVLLETCRLYENNMVAYYTALTGWINVFGDGEIAVRSLSLLFAVLSIVAFRSMAGRFFSPMIAGISGLAFTLNPLFLYYAIEARGYSMLLLAAIISTHLFLLLVNKPSLRNMLLYLSTTALSVYIHYFGLLLLPVHFGMALFVRQTAVPWRWLIAAWTMVVILVCPLLIFKPASSEQLLWMSEPTGKVLLNGLSRLFGGTVFLFAYMAVLGLSWRPGRTAADMTDRQTFNLAGVWILLPLVIVYLFSVLAKPIFLYRYFIWLLPAAAVLVGLLVRFARAASPWLAGLAGIIISAQVFPAVSMLRVKGSGYRDAADYIKGQAQEGDAVLAYPFVKADHYRYYLDKQPTGKAYLEPSTFHASGYLPGGGGREPDPDLQRLDSIAKGAHRVFLICNAALLESDARQHRIALPAIEQQLSKIFPLQQSRVFGGDFEAPTRVVIFSR